MAAAAVKTAPSGSARNEQARADEYIRVFHDWHCVYSNVTTVEASQLGLAEQTTFSQFDKPKWDKDQA